MVWDGDENLPDQGSPRAGGAWLRLWPWILNVSFGIVFLGIADIVWYTAGSTTTRWFTSAVSAQTYASTLVVAAVGAFALALIAINRIAAIESTKRPIGFREQKDHGEIGPSHELTADLQVPRDEPLAPERFDRIMEDIERFTDAPVLVVQNVRHGSAGRMLLARQSTLFHGAGTTESRRPPVVESDLRARLRAWQAVAGPLTMFLIFAAIGGAMLPGSGTFAATNFQLNTALVLFLGYSWPFLVAWALAAIVLLYISPRGHTREA